MFPGLASHWETAPSPEAVRCLSLLRKISEFPCGHAGKLNVISIHFAKDLLTGAELFPGESSSELTGWLNQWQAQAMHLGSCSWLACRTIG